MSETCPIWGTSAKSIPGYERRDGVAVDSPRAGGRYFISRTAVAVLKDCDDLLKAKVSFEIARNNAVNSVPEILSTTVESALLQSGMRVEDRAKMLLRYLARETQHIGHTIGGFTLQKPVQIPGVIGVREEAGPKAHALFAWSGSLHSDEVIFLIDMLVERGAIRRESDDLIPDMTVLAKGFEQVTVADAAPDLEQAFVAMWFDECMLAAYEVGIDAAVRASGYRPLRIDRKEHVNKIDDEIIAELRKSSFVIADFTSEPGSPRGGVYFEAGFALALGKPVIWTCRNDLIGEVHFDTRQFNHIVWSSPEELAAKLRNRIGAVIGLGPLNIG